MYYIHYTIFKYAYHLNVEYFLLQKAIITFTCLLKARDIKEKLSPKSNKTNVNIRLTKKVSPTTLGFASV